MTRDAEKILLVTGGGRGIGAATCRLAAAAGYCVAVNYARDEAAATALVAGLEAAGTRAAAFRGDMAEPGAADALVAAVVERFGGLTHLVNNAGITGTGARLADADPAMITRVIELNVTGAIMVARAAAQAMATSRGGRGGVMVNVSSAAATLGSPGEFVWYAASKGAIDSLTIGLSRELAADGIRVNAVAPGLIETGIHADAGMPDRVERMAPNIPLARAGSPEEVAQTILFLLSDASSYVSGTIVRVAGGR